MSAAVEETTVKDLPAEPATTDSAKTDTEKDGIYRMISEFIHERTGKRIGLTASREIFDIVVENTFAIAARDGSFRFNGGFGSLHAKTYKAGSRRLPSGMQTTFGDRKKIRYEEGVVVKALIKNGGQLAKAIAEGRGTRQPVVKQVVEAAKPAKAPKPAKQEVKPIVQKAAPVQAAPAPVVDTDDVDLS